MVCPLASKAFLLAKAAEMRNSPTPAEARLRDALQGCALGVRFRQQRPIGRRFIADFASLDARLVVEVDGPYHDAPLQKAEDAKRDAALATLGYKTLRFRNAEVLADLAKVVERIKAEVDLRRNHGSAARVTSARQESAEASPLQAPHLEADPRRAWWGAANKPPVKTGGTVYQPAPKGKPRGGGWYNWIVNHPDPEVRRGDKSYDQAMAEAKAKYGTQGAASYGRKRAAEFAAQRKAEKRRKKREKRRAAKQNAPAPLPKQPRNIDHWLAHFVAKQAQCSVGRSGSPQS